MIIPFMMIALGALLASSYDKANALEGRSLPSIDVTVKVQKILEEIERSKYPIRTDADRIKIARDSLSVIKADETVKRQVVKAIEELGGAFFKASINHPSIDIVVDVLEVDALKGLR
ncbi:MAG: hypothetical protein ACFBSC_22460 [Microcoleaceae cyanobacterium]